jgi:integrase
VPLSTRATKALQAIPRRLDGWVFGMTKYSITQAFARISGTASAKKQARSRDRWEPMVNLRFHDLRHEATSRLCEKGLNPLQVAAITGHKTLSMLRRYTHLRAQDLAVLLG